ncbi:hypothetical protein ABPG72_007100 [Tetrahymena utriculariae]
MKIKITQDITQHYLQTLIITFKRKSMLMQRACLTNFLNFIIQKSLINLRANYKNSNLLSHIETIYSNLFGHELFQVFKELQQFEIINRGKGVSIDVVKIKNLFKVFKNEITNKPNSYGKGLILILSVIYTILLRLGGKYDEAIKHMNLIFQICNQTKTGFQQFLDLFFKYNSIICYLYKIVSIKSDKFHQRYQFVRKFHQTNLNLLLEYKKGNDNYIFKIQKTNEKESKNQQINEQNRFQQLNEACIQMLLCHPNIQNIEEVFANQTLEIVIVQKKQGQNLKQLLTQKIVDQEQAMSYIQQILSACQYLHSLNIIHSDFKLENVVTVLDDETKIKIIDFGFSQIKIFNKFFTPLGYTENYAPSEEVYTFESDIFSIGESITKIYEYQNLYKSKQMAQLIERMKENELQKRCTINEAQRKFQLEMFTYKIFEKIISKQENASDQNFEIRQQIYENFADSVHFLFQKFRRFHYNTFSVQQESNNEKIQFNEFQNKNQQFNINAIIQSIKFLLDPSEDSKKECFVDCLTYNDIKLFVLKLLSCDKEISNNSKNQNNQIDEKLLEKCFSETNYKEDQYIEKLINNIIMNKYKSTNQIIEQIEKELSNIKYSNNELSETNEYQKLIDNIEEQLKLLENNCNLNTQNNIQEESTNRSTQINNNRYQQNSENSINLIQIGSLNYSGSQQILESQESQEYNFFFSSDSQYQISNSQQPDQQSKQTNSTKYSQSQSQIQSQRQTNYSYLSTRYHQQPNSQLEFQYQNNTNNSTISIQFDNV